MNAYLHSVTALNALRLPALGLAAIVLLGACTKSPATSGAAATAGATAPECEKLQKRIEHCKANIKQGHFDMKFDPGFTQSAEACREADKLVDSLAQQTGCES